MAGQELLYLPADRPSAAVDWELYVACSQNIERELDEWQNYRVESNNVGVREHGRTLDLNDQTFRDNDE